MLEVLLWLDRFDLDGKQATTRRLSSLVENRQMPLRKVHRVEYNGEWRNFNVPPCKSSLSIFFRESYSAEIEIRIGEFMLQIFRNAAFDLSFQRPRF